MAPSFSVVVLVGHDELGVDRLLGAEPVAVRAGAEGIVEGEEPRLDLGDGEAGDGAGEFFREDDALVRLVLRLVGGAAGDLIGAGSGLSANSAMAMPSAIFSAVSSESARRAAMSGRTTTRSTTMSMSCFSFLSSAGASAIS